MAEGLLASGLNYIDQQKQALAARLGLLMNNPQEFAAQLGSEARQRAGVGLLGEPKTAQDMASGAWINSPYGHQAMQAGSGFAGTIIGKPLDNVFNIVKKDASDIFGAGAEKIRYIDPKSGGTIEILSKPDKSASVLSLEVPEQFRGKKIGESLQARVLQDFPEMQGQVSSKAAAKTAYRLGRRPVGQPNATLDDVFKTIDQDSSVNLVSPEMQKRFIK
jgi:predicted GNAT family acetyltransferase